MRQHRLALCREDFLEWMLEQTARFIARYDMFSRNEKILVAVSGGKDSLSLWDLLIRLGYQADGLYLGLGIDGGLGYSTESSRMAQQFAAHNHLTLHVVDIEQQYGYSIPVLAEISRRGHGRPCAVCGLAKRHELNRIARDMGYDVLATGHNLDDEAAVLFGNTLRWSTEYLVRQGPVLPEVPGMARKVKPLCRFYEREMASYAVLRGIEYIYEECPYANGSTTIYYKEALSRLENDHPGTKLNFYLRFLEARARGEVCMDRDMKQELHTCMQCGQPTSAPGKCSFCRMLEKAAATVH